MTRDAKSLTKLYAKRWSIECGFHDTKDLRFGMGMIRRGSAHPTGATACGGSTPSLWPAASLALRAAGVALPPTVREAAAS